MIAYRPRPKIPAIRVPPAAPVMRASETSHQQWRAIYALCRPEELRAEDARLVQEMALDATLAQSANLRRALVREQLAALGEP